MPDIKRTPDQAFMSTLEVAKRLGLHSQQTVYRLVSDGEFPGAIKIGSSQSSQIRIPVGDFEAFIERSRIDQPASGNGGHR